MRSNRFQRGYLGPANRRVLGGGSGGASLPITQNLAAWFKYGAGITVTGAGVSQWDDRSGNGRHLKQGTDTNRPAKQSDGSILFDGADNYLKCDAFTLNQPLTLYFLMKQVAWTGNLFVSDGNTGSSVVVYQPAAGSGGVSPELGLFAGSDAAQDGGLAVGAYGAVSAVFNGASSLIQINANTPTTGNVGANNAGGFTLASRATGSNFSNIQVKEVIIYSAAHDAGQRAAVISYLRSVGGI